MSNDYWWQKEEKRMNLGKFWKGQGVKLEEAIESALKLTQNGLGRDKYLEDIREAYNAKQPDIIKIRDEIIQKNKKKEELIKAKHLLEQLKAQKKKKPNKPKQLKIPFLKRK